MFKHLQQITEGETCPKLTDEQKELENRIDYFTYLAVCEEIKNNQLEREEFYNKYKGKPLNEILTGIVQEIEEWCRPYCCRLSIESTTDKDIDFVQIIKGDIPLMTKRIISFSDLHSYHECELGHIYREWYDFRREVKKFILTNSKIYTIIKT